MNVSECRFEIKTLQNGESKNLTNYTIWFIPCYLQISPNGKYVSYISSRFHSSIKLTALWRAKKCLDKIQESLQNCFSLVFIWLMYEKKLPIITTNNYNDNNNIDKTWQWPTSAEWHFLSSFWKLQILYLISIYCMNHWNSVYLCIGSLHTYQLQRIKLKRLWC